MEFLLGALTALVNQRTDRKLQIVAVDSGSWDGTVALLEQYPVLLHRVPTAEFNHGGTRNLGVRLAKGDFVVLLTQDAVPIGPDFIMNIVRPFDDPRVAGVYGRQIARPDCDVVTRRQLEQGLTGRAEASLSHLDGRRLSDLSPFEQYELCTFDNVCSAIRRRVWQLIPFPYMQFGEDLAWGKKVVEAGWAIAYEPTAAVYHSHRRSVLYEYERMRVCHRLLHDLFGMATLPRWRYVVRAWGRNLRHDLPFVLHQAPSGIDRFRQLFRVAALSVLGPYAQYRGYKNAVAIRGKR
jgi:rhamnosyltransferase